MKTIAEEQEEKIGKAIAEVLQLKKNKLGRYDTTWGDKTDLGLYWIIERIIEETK
jgi:hypothetical protein